MLSRKEAGAGMQVQECRCRNAVPRMLQFSSKRLSFQLVFRLARELE
jgi:hypothetical protein